MATLNWLNIERPDDVKDPSFRRQVRAEVTRLQHRQTRERSRRNALQSSSGSSASSSTTTTPEQPLHVAKPRKTKSYKARPAKVQHGPPRRTTRSCQEGSEPEKDDEPQTSAPPDTAPSESGTILLTPDTWKHPGGSLAKAFSRGEMAYRTFALDDPDNVVGENLCALELDLSCIMSLYNSVGLTQARDFHRQFGLVEQKGMPCTRLYRLVHTDPVALLTVILIGVRISLDKLGRARPRGRDLVVMVELERHLIRSINHALHDPVRGISDEMLAAVALCAAYEVKHGDAERYDIHMRGLVRMIELRGGFREIGRDDLYLVRLLVWIDVNTSKIAGRQAYLQNMYDGLETAQPQANLTVFRSPDLQLSPEVPPVREK